MRDQHRSRHTIAILGVAAILLAGCGATSVANSLDDGSAVLAPDDLPELDPMRIRQGADLYAAFCSSCHGIDLAGASDWKLPNPDGSYKPPPQDSTGHTWHHSDRVLVDLISNGSEFAQSRMPEFGDALSRTEILAILDYFRSNWGPDERVAQWQASSQDR